MNLDFYEQQYDREERMLRPLMNDLRKRRDKILSKQELDNKEEAQLKFLIRIIEGMEIMNGITHHLRHEYWRSIDGVLDLEIQYNKEKLLNIELTKQLVRVHNGDMLLAQIRAKLPEGTRIVPIRVDYTCIEHNELGCKQCRKL